jgi:hypothetical protein
MGRHLGKLLISRSAVQVTGATCFIKVFNCVVEHIGVRQGRVVIELLYPGGESDL